MDFNRLITMAMSMFMKRFIATAVDKGIDYAARRGKPEAEMTEAERASAGQGRQMADRAKQIRNATRRFF